MSNESIRYCVYCGNKFALGENFCMECGKKIPSDTNFLIKSNVNDSPSPLSPTSPNPIHPHIPKQIFPPEIRDPNKPSGQYPHQQTYPTKPITPTGLYLIKPVKLAPQPFSTYLKGFLMLDTSIIKKEFANNNNRNSYFMLIIFFILNFILVSLFMYFFPFYLTSDVISEISSTDIVGSGSGDIFNDTLIYTFPFWFSFLFTIQFFIGVFLFTAIFTMYANRPAFNKALTVASASLIPLVVYQILRVAIAIMLDGNPNSLLTINNIDELNVVLIKVMDQDIAVYPIIRLFLNLFRAIWSFILMIKILNNSGMKQDSIIVLAFSYTFLGGGISEIIDILTFNFF